MLSGQVQRGFVLGCSEATEITSPAGMQRKRGQKALPCCSRWSSIPQLFQGQSLLPDHPLSPSKTSLHSLVLWDNSKWWWLGPRWVWEKQILQPQSCDLHRALGVACSSFGAVFHIILGDVYLSSESRRMEGQWQKGCHSKRGRLSAVGRPESWTGVNKDNFSVWRIFRFGNLHFFYPIGLERAVGSL